MKQVKKVVIYYTDGTYQEVDAAIAGGGGGSPMPYQGPVKRTPVKPVEIVPFEEQPYPWKLPGEAGKWPYPPYDVGTTIVD